MLFRTRSALVAIALFLGPYASAQTLPPGVQKKASVGGITEYDYPNGLRVLLYPDQANPKVTLLRWCGSQVRASKSAMIASEIAVAMATRADALPAPLSSVSTAAFVMNSISTTQDRTGW